MFKNDNHTFAVCAYKESAHLESCIRSLTKQTVPSTIIVTTSTPNSHIETLCKKYNLPLHINTGTTGIAGDWNFALNCAKTDLVTLAHQDDVYMPTYTEEMLASINDAEKPVLYFTNYGELRNDSYVNDNKLLRVKRKLLKPLESKKNQNKQSKKRLSLCLGNGICCPSATLIPEVFPCKPFFQSEFGSNLDWQAWTTLYKIPGSFVYNPKILMYHRIHEESETSHLIENDTRSAEDFAMLNQFWPSWIARLLNHFYKKGQESNS